MTRLRPLTGQATLHVQKRPMLARCLHCRWCAWTPIDRLAVPVRKRPTLARPPRKRSVLAHPLFPRCRAWTPIATVVARESSFQGNRQYMRRVSPSSSRVITVCSNASVACPISPSARYKTYKKPIPPNPAGSKLRKGGGRKTGSMLQILSGAEACVRG